MCVGTDVESKLGVEITFTNQKIAWIKGMLSQTHGLKFFHCGQKPSTRVINLPIAKLQQKYPDLRTRSQQLKIFSRKLDPARK